MFVQSVNLRNVRSFENIELNFSKGINLLVGNNNSGKSTIIKSLYKLQEPNTLGPDDVRKTKSSSRIVIDLHGISERDAFLFTINHKGNAPAPKASPIKVIFNSSTSFLQPKIGVEHLWFNSDIPHEMDTTGKIKLLGDNNNPQSFTDFYGLPNIETLDNFIYPFFSKRKAYSYNHQNFGTKESFSVSDDLRNITPKIQKIGNPSHPKNKEFVRLVNEILGFTIGVIPHRENDSNTGIFVTDTMVIPIEHMGEGVVNIIGLLVLLLTEDHKLYLIEEPENDIHPAALKKLLQVIISKSSNNQFVISTHSNIVVKHLGIPSAKIFRIEWKPYFKVKSDKLPTSLVNEIANTPGPKMELLESLGYDLFDFDLYKSYILFEESSAEKIVRDFLIPEFCPSLQFKVKTIAVSGSSDLEPRFHNFLSLFVFIHQTPIYHAKAWVFADGDKSGKASIASLKKKFTSWPRDCFINF